MLLSSTFNDINILVSSERIKEDIDSLFFYDGIFYLDEELGGYSIRISDGGYDFEEFLENSDLPYYLEISIVSEEEIGFNGQDYLIDFAYDAGIVLDAIACEEIYTMNEYGYISRFDLNQENLENRANELDVEIFNNPGEWIEKYSHKVKRICMKDILEEKLLNTDEGIKVKNKTFIVKRANFKISTNTDKKHLFNMPNKNTFQIPCIKKLIEEETSTGLWVDPFANSNNWAHIKNELNSEYLTDFHLDALIFLKGIKSKSVDGVVFDPPYSLEQIRRAYKNVGIKTNDTSFKNNKDLIDYHNAVKKELARILVDGGKVICFGWTHLGIGGIIDEKMFFMNELMLIKHGGMHNDTIVTIEIKNSSSKKGKIINKEKIPSQMMFFFNEISTIKAISLMKEELLDIEIIDSLSNNIISYSRQINEDKEKVILSFQEDSNKHPLFQCSIRNVLYNEIKVKGGLWIDPFAERNFEAQDPLCHITNSLNKNYKADFHLDPCKFLKLFKDSSVHGVLFNPPLDPKESSEYYKINSGSSKNTNCGNGKWWSEMKNEISRITKKHGKVIAFGRNSVGMGKKRGFTTKEIRIISYKDDYSLIIAIEEKI